SPVRHHDPTASGTSSTSSGSASRPVSAKKTSSREGWWTCTSSTAIPASSSARTIRVARPTGFGTDARIWRPSRLTWTDPSTSGPSAGSAASSARERATSNCAPPMRRLSSSGLPAAIVRPWSTTTTRSASSSASSRYCVVSRSVVPSATRVRITFHIRRRLTGSSPVVGSSRNSTGGRVTRLAARSSRRRMPPEEVFAMRPAGSLRSNPSGHPAHQHEVLGAGEQLVEAGVLPGHTDDPAHGGGVGHDVEAADPARAGVGGGHGREQAGGRGLARPVGAEHAEYPPGGDDEVDAVDRDLIAVALGEAPRRDHRSCHDVFSAFSGGLGLLADRQVTYLSHVKWQLAGRQVKWRC